MKKLPNPVPLPAPRYDLVPKVLLQAVAQRFALGALKYGEDDLESKLSDPEFLRVRAEHALAHLRDYIAGSGEEGDWGNLSAVGWAVAILLEALRLRAALVPSPGRGPAAKEAAKQ